MPVIPVRPPLFLSVLVGTALVAVTACAAPSPASAVAATGLASSAHVASSAPAVGSTAVSSAAASSAPAAGGQTLRQVWPAGADAAWAWTQGNGGPQGIARTVNGGQTWATVTPPGLAQQTGDHVISGFFALGSQHAWVAYGGIAAGAVQHITTTSDGGRHWTVVGREPLTKVAFSPYVYNCGLDFVTPTDGWCQAEPAFVGSEGVDLYRTTDGGRHWRRVSVTGPNGNKAGSLPWACAKNIQFTSETRGWAIFTCPKAAPLYETTDAGRTWVRRRVAAPPGPVDSGSGFTGQPLVSGNRGAVGYTIFGAPQKSVVYVSANGGAAWRPVTPPGPSQGWVADAISGTSWRLVAGDHILATDNAGRT
jgi:hypothetical protein